MEFSPSEISTGKIDESKLESLLKAFRKDGCIVLKDVFSKGKIECLNNCLTKNYADYLENKEYDDALKVGHKRHNITIDINGEFNAPDIYCHPLILEILHHLLEPRFVISDLTCVLSLPGSKQMQVHRDGVIFNNSPVRGLLPPFAIGVLIPLVPFTKTNGTTRFWPGSHLGTSSVEEIAQSPDFIDAEIDTGSCILMDYRLCHRGKPNNSDTVRPLLYCNYCNHWYLDSGNFKKQAHFYMSDQELMKMPEQHRGMFVRRNIDLSSTYKLLGPHQASSNN